MTSNARERKNNNERGGARAENPRHGKIILHEKMRWASERPYTPATVRNLILQIIIHALDRSGWSYLSISDQRTWRPGSDLACTRQNLDARTAKAPVGRTSKYQHSEWGVRQVVGGALTIHDR